MLNRAYWVVSWTHLGSTFRQSGSPIAPLPFPTENHNTTKDKWAVWSTGLCSKTQQRQLDTQLISKGDHPPTNFSKIRGWHLSAQGDEWFWSPQSLPRCTTPCRHVPADAAIQPAHFPATGLKLQSNSIKRASGQKEVGGGIQKRSVYTMALSSCSWQGTRYQQQWLIIKLMGWKIIFEIDGLRRATSQVYDAHSQRFSRQLSCLGPSQQHGANKSVF